MKKCEVEKKDALLNTIEVLLKKTKSFIKFWGIKYNIRL